jgi:hypothetical protein
MTLTGAVASLVGSAWIFVQGQRELSVILLITAIVLAVAYGFSDE